MQAPGSLCQRHTPRGSWASSYRRTISSGSKLLAYLEPTRRCPRRASLQPCRAAAKKKTTAKKVSEAADIPVEGQPESEASASQANGVETGERVSDLPAALAEAEAAVRDGTFDISSLETLIPEAVSEVESLLARVEEAEAAKTEAEDKAADSKERYLRLNADFDNFRKRSGAEKDQIGERIRGDVIKSLVPLVDSFEAAQNSVKAETENEQKINGAYQGLYKQMVETFKSLGVEAVPGVGEPFDPEFHDAIMREPNEELPDGTVLQEFRRGFRLGKTLLRPGMVKVSFTETAGTTGATEEEAVDA